MLAAGATWFADVFGDVASVHAASISNVPSPIVHSLMFMHFVLGKGPRHIRGADHESRDSLHLYAPATAIGHMVVTA